MSDNKKKAQGGSEEFSMTPPVVGCSTISFQHLPLSRALESLRALGFTHIDLGALPGVCDHVPAQLSEMSITEIGRNIRHSGLKVVTVNADVGDFNLPHPDRKARDAHLEQLLKLTALLKASALVLPCGGLKQTPYRSEDEDLQQIADELRNAALLAERHGVEIWVESLHFLRFCSTRARAQSVHDRLVGSGVQPVLDVAHIAAAQEDPFEVIADWGSSIRHVHLRDAAPWDFNRPIGEGTVDFLHVFAALEATGFEGACILELPSAAYNEDASAPLEPDLHAAKEQLVARTRDVMTEALRRTPFSSRLPKEQ